MMASAQMKLVDALRVLSDFRRDQVVVSTMSAAREWMTLSAHPLDFHYIPSTMGGGFSLGLGIALARPERQVIVLNGDGCVLMNLGSLITSAQSHAQNFTGIVVDNGNYETTGGQLLATSGSDIQIADFARAAKFPSVKVFASLDDWSSGIAAAMTSPGPRCIILKVTSEGDHTLRSPGPMAARVKAFKAQIASG